MRKRFVAIWFRHLKTDWMIRRQPQLKDVPFVLAFSDRGRIIITEVSAAAKNRGLRAGMIVADARVAVPEVKVLNDKAELAKKLLDNLALWCIRYTPTTAIDAPDGLTLDVTGCTHLWHDEENYLQHIVSKLRGLGYHVRAAMADTVGTAWAVCRYGKIKAIIKSGEQVEALMALPPAALRLETDTVDRLQKLGLHQISSFMHMQRSALRKRFGQQFIKRLGQALGHEEEVIQPVLQPEPYHERLPCLEPITTANGIAIALERLLETLCNRLKQEQKGLRVSVFKGYRVDGGMEKIEISTNHPSNNIHHLFKLFELRLPTIEPALGIELFTLDALKVEDISPLQEKLWEQGGGLNDVSLAELLDRLQGRIGPNRIHRYLPVEHHWPERSIKRASSLLEKMSTSWRVDRPRPLQFLSAPEPIEVTAPVPDYPPMLFRYKGKIHKIIKADGPERIEQEWWLQNGQHRDYYSVEDEEGYRYWLFRSGHYDADKSYKWFIHGLFA